MVHTGARFVAGVVGNVISAELFLSPIPTFIQIWRKMEMEAFDPTLYFLTVLNCSCWCLYRLPYVSPNSNLVVTINGVGLLMELIHFFIFFYYATAEGRKKVVKYSIADLILFGVLVTGTMLGMPEHKMTMNRSWMAVFVGMICDIFNFITISSPSFNLKDVIKSVKYVPLPLMVANFLKCCCWTSYALNFRTNSVVLLCYMLHYCTDRRRRPFWKAYH